MSINGTISAGFNFNDNRTVATGTLANIPINPLGINITYSNGAGANEVSQIYGVLGTFSGTTATINLNSGLSDGYGTAVTLVRFKAILIINTGADLITVGGGSDAISTWLSATGTMVLPPGAWTQSGTPDATGWAITASTAMNLLLTGTSGQTYTFAVAGATS